MVIGVVIQARMRSTRLPGKVLMPVAGKPLLDHIVSRALAIRHPVHTIVATGDNAANDDIESFCLERGVACFRGNEADVLGRYFACAQGFGLNHVVRLTADNPFVDISELDALIEMHLSQGNDYSSSLGELPIGVGAEAFSLPALERSVRFGTEPHHREHVNEYILEHRMEFKIGVLSVPDDKRCPALRLTVDTLEDYRRICYIAENCGERPVTTKAAIMLCTSSA